MAANVNYQLLKQLPQINQIIDALQHEDEAAALPRQSLTEEARAVVGDARKSILAGRDCDVSLAAISAAVSARCRRKLAPSLRRAVNASGVIVHTNLGRSPLAPAAQKAVSDVIAGYSTLEYSCESMGRGSRHSHYERLICMLTGAEAAIAVNNNAAAVMMVLSEFASGREAIVSRGELVEIGGSFRIPDIMAQSNARMVEVGTTNKTHPFDYSRAITPETGMLLKAHRSNFRITGFTESTELEELRKIADAENAKRAPEDALLVYEDQGSGAFIRLDAFGDYAEPAVVESLRKGADLVSFSGDKLLGGPQAGIIVGRKELIDRLKKNPLARVLRLDKMTLAALEATLQLYLDPQRAREEIPTLRLLSEDAETVKQRAQQMLQLFAQAVPEDAAQLCVVEEVSRAGGGALPMCEIPSYAVRLEFFRGRAQDCETYLVQQLPVPVIARIQQDMLYFSARTVLNAEEQHIAAEGLAAYFQQLGA